MAQTRLTKRSVSIQLVSLQSREEKAKALIEPSLPSRVSIQLVSLQSRESRKIAELLNENKFPFN
jgi:hypothetical protein